MRSIACLLILAAACSTSDEQRAAGPEDSLSVPDGPPIGLAHIEAAPELEVSRDFLIGRYEVTNAQYEVFIRATGYDGSDHPSSKPTEPFLSDFAGGRCPSGRERHPVCYINVHHARAFCRWLSERSGRVVRLPADAEWELAARGPQHRTYPWGDEWDPKRCNWGDGGEADGFLESAPVGSFARGATPDGIFDLAGNIWEWTEEGNLRGGPWCMGPETVRSANVSREDNDRCDDKFGLRIVVELP